MRLMNGFMTQVQKSDTYGYQIQPIQSPNSKVSKRE